MGGSGGQRAQTPQGLAELAEGTVPGYSNLWVPAVGGPAVEAELAPPSDGLEDRP